MQAVEAPGWEDVERPRVIVVSPLAAREGRTVEDHEEYLGRCLEHCLLNGWAPMAGHGLFPRFFPDSDPEQVERCMQAQWAWTPSASFIAIFNDYGVAGRMLDDLRFYRTFDVDIRFIRIGKNKKRKRK